MTVTLLLFTLWKICVQMTATPFLSKSTTTTTTMNTIACTKLYNNVEKRAVTVQSVVQQSMQNVCVLEHRVYLPWSHGGSCSRSLWAVKSEHRFEQFCPSHQSSVLAHSYPLHTEPEGGICHTHLESNVHDATQDYHTLTLFTQSLKGEYYVHLDSNNTIQWTTTQTIPPHTEPEGGIHQL